MKISPVTNYYYNRMPAFKGRDENQTLTPELRAIFADSTVPKYQQRILWRLSEIPDFCEASKNTPKSDLIELSETLAKADTNILDMALHGDIKISLLDDENLTLRDLLPLSLIAKRNRKPEIYGKRSLLDIIKALPIFQIEKDAKEVYSKSNTYPPNLILKGNGTYEVADTFIAETDKQKVQEILSMKYAFGDALSIHDGIVIFDKRIKGKNDNVIVDNPIPKDYIEEEIITPPERLSVFYKRDDLKKSFFSLSEAPYFYNLVKETPLENIEIIAKMNKDHEDIIARALKKDLTIDIINPAEKQKIELPIVDAKRILLNKKFGEYQTNDFYNILFATTPVIALCMLRYICLKARPDAHISSILLSKDDNTIFTVYHLKTDEGKSNLICKMPTENYIAKKFLPILDKAPFKTANINFDKE